MLWPTLKPSRPSASSYKKSLLEIDPDGILEQSDFEAFTGQIGWRRAVGPSIRGKSK